MRYVHKLYDALEKKGVLEKYWSDPEFDCFDQFAPDVREIMATMALESQFSNGGASQLLWNCRTHLETLLNLAEQGYERFGARKAAGEVRKLKRTLPNWFARLDQFQKRHGVTPDRVGKWYVDFEKRISKDARLKDFPFEEGSKHREAYLKPNIKRILGSVRDIRC